MKAFRFSVSTSTIAALFAASTFIACAAPPTAPKTLAAGASCGKLDSDKLVEDLYSSKNIYAVFPVKERIFKARANQPVRTVGASLQVRAEPGLSSPYLRRVLACHAVSEHQVHPNDPLHPKSGHVTEIDVSELRHGFSVKILSDEPGVGEEIFRRAESLKNQRSTVEVQQVSSAARFSNSL